MPEFPDLSSKPCPSIMIGRICILLVSALGIACFALSFEALRDLAIQSGALPSSVAWVLPFIVDGAAVVYALSAFRAQIIGDQRGSRWFFCLVVIITLVSLGLNIAHAQKGWLPSFIAALPPLLLFAAFESLLRQVHPQGGSPARKPKASPRPGKAPSVPSETEVEFRRAKAISLAEEGLSKARIARELGVSSATVSRYLGRGRAA